MNIPKYRTYNGLRYRRAYTKNTKSAAQKEEKEMRTSGSSVRIEKYGKKYVLYARG